MIGSHASKPASVYLYTVMYCNAEPADHAPEEMLEKTEHSMRQILVGWIEFFRGWIMTGTETRLLAGQITGPCVGLLVVFRLHRAPLCQTTGASLAFLIV
jgi:hypothetical protein